MSEISGGTESPETKSPAGSLPETEAESSVPPTVPPAVESAESDGTPEDPPKKTSLLKTINIDYRQVAITLLSLIGALVLIVGALLPWVKTESLGDVIHPAIGYYSGAGYFGEGFGLLTLIIGVLVLISIVRAPFGISQRFWLGSMGLTAALLMIAHLFNETAADGNDDISHTWGVWITYIGVGLILVSFLLASVTESKKEPGHSKNLRMTSSISITMLAPIGLVSAILLPYWNITLVYLITAPELEVLARVEEGVVTDLLKNDLRGTGAIIVSILGAMLLSLYWNYTSKRKVPAKYFALGSFIVMLLSLIAFIGVFQFGSFTVLGAGNWGVLVTAAVIFYLSFRDSLKDDSGELESLMRFIRI